MAELKLSLTIDDKGAITDLKALQKIIDDLKKQMKNMPFGGGGTGGAPKMPKPDMSAFRDYKLEASRASVETVKLGRELDQLNKKFGIGSKEAKDFSNSQLANNRVLNLQQNALMSLKKAYQEGAIGVKQYQLETAKLINQQANFKNKMTGASPVRNIQGMMSQMLGSLGGELNRFTTGQLMIPDAISPARLMAIREGLLGVEEASGATSATLGAMFKTFMFGTTVLAGFAGVVGGVLVGINAVKTGKEFEDMEFQMAALVNASTQFKDKATGQFVGFEKNLQLSLDHGKALIAQFANDAPGLAGTNLQELTETAAISVGNLAGNGVVKAIDQAKIIEGLTVAVKTVTRGMANQLPSEIRGVINEDFRKANTLINQIADKMGGKERYQELAKEARARGEYGQFLLQALDPYIKAANFASGSLSNLQEIFTDTLTNFNRIVAAGGLFEVFKEIPKQILGAFVSLDQANFGKLKDNIAQLAREIGTSLKGAVQAILPLMPALSQIFIGLLTLIPPVINTISPFVFALSSIVNVLVQFIAQNQGVQASLKALFMGFIALQAVQFISVLITSFGTALAALPALFATSTAATEGATVAFLGLNTVILANPFAWAIAGLVALGAAFVALAPDIETLTKQIEEGMSKNVQIVLNSAVSIGDILDKLKNGVALNANEMAVVWGNGLLKWYQKTGIVLKGIMNDMGSTFKWIETKIAWLFNSFKTFGAVAGSLLQGNVSGAMGELLKGTLREGGRKARENRLQTNILNAGMGLGGTPSVGGGLSNFDALSKYSPETTTGKKKKGSSQDTLNSRADADLERENKKKAAEESLQQAIKEREEAEKLIQTKEELNKKEAEIFNQRLQASRYSLVADQALHELDIQKSRIENAYKNKQITEQQKNALLEQNAIRKIELNYQNQMHEVGLKELTLQEKQLAMKRAIAEATEQRHAIGEKIAKAKTEISTIRGELTNGQFKTDKARDEAEAKVTNLKTEIEKLNKQLAEIVASSKEKIDKATQEVRQGKQDVTLETQKAQQERSQALKSVSLDYSQIANENADKQRKALFDGAKEIFNQITSAFSDGKLTLEEAFGIFTSILEKAKGIFSSSGSGGGFSFGNLFGGFGSGGGATKGADGAFDGVIRDSNLQPIFDTATQAVDGLSKSSEQASSSCGKLNGSFGSLSGAVGGLIGGFGKMLGSVVSGIGGMFGKSGAGEGISGFFSKFGGAAKGGAGGAEGANPASGILSGIMTAATIGMTVYSFFQSKKKAKKEAQTKKQIEAIKAITTAAFNQIDLLQKQFAERLQVFKDNIDDINREIRKIDVGTSLYQGQKVIEKTIKQLQMTVDQIGKGTKLIINSSYWNAYWQGMQVFQITIEGLQNEATGLYAERNQQIFALLQARQQVVSSITNNGDVEKAAFEQIDSINRKIVEINDSFNDQIRDMTNQSKDIQEQLDKAIEQQKQNYLMWSRRVQKEITSVQFGEGAGQMFDSMIEAVDQIREVLISGIDPRLADFMVQRIKEQATNKLKNQYREFIEGVNDDYLKSITDLQDRLQAVISEGRITGRLKKTQTQKLQEIQRDIDKLVGQQVAGSSLDLNKFGISVSTATNALDQLTNVLNTNIQNTLDQVSMGKYRSIDAINVNTVFTPEVIAAEVQKQLNAKLNTPSLLTAPLV